MLAVSLLGGPSESPRYLAARSARWPELVRFKQGGIAVGPTEFIEASGASSTGSSRPSLHPA
jgi:hypothetical protein